MSGIRERKKKKTRQAIFNAAIQLFTERGYERTSIDDIAAEAGVGKGTIYGYFSAKDEIFKAFCDDEIERAFLSLMKKIDTDEPLLKQLVALFMFQFHHMTRNREFGRHLLRELGFPKVISQKSIENDQRYLEMLEELLSTAREKGQIKPDVNLRTASANFYMLFFGCLSAWYGGFWPDEKAVEEAMAQLFQQVLEGIGS